MVTASNLLFTALVTRKSIDQNYAQAKSLTLMTESDMVSMVTTSLGGRVTLYRRPWMHYPVASVPMPIAVFLRSSRRKIR